MCEKRKTIGRGIDKCIKTFIENLRLYINPQFQIVSSCCGHGKYPMTIIAKLPLGMYDLVSGKNIPRKKRFYLKDNSGYYYIPEVVRVD